MLAEVAREEVDAIVFGGDLFLGPQPAETLGARPHRGRATFVRGNCDREPDDWDAVEARRRDARLGAVAGRTTVEHDGVLYCHASPKRRHAPILTDASPPERFDEALDGVDARLVVAGHTHMQFRARQRWVNAGAVGWPYEDDVAAFWAVVSDDVEFRRTPIDVERVVAEIARLRLARALRVRRREPPHAAVAGRGDRLFRVQA